MIEPVEIEWRELAGEVATNVQRQLQEIADASKMTAAGMQQTSVAAEVFKGVGLEHAVEKVVDQFLQFHQRVIAQSTAFHELSQRVNIGVEDYQALRLAGIEAGVSTEQLQSAMVRFQSAIGQAEQGSKLQIDALNQLGIKILDVHGKVRPWTDLLREAAAAMLQMESGTLRTRLETEFFGRSGAVLTPTLQTLAGGVSNLTDKFRAAGQILSKETVEELKRLEIQSQAAQARIETLWAAFAAPIQTRVVATMTMQFADLAQKIKDAKFNWDDLVKALRNPSGAVLDLATKAYEASNPDKILAGKVADKQKELATIERQIADGPGLFGRSTKKLEADRDRVQGELQTLQDEARAIDQAKVNAANMQRLTGDGLLPADRAATAGSGNPTATGSGSKRDRIQEGIEQFKAQAKAAADASAVLEKAQPDTQLLKDIERAAELQKRVGDLVASASKANPSDPRIQQLRDAAASAVAAQQAEEKLKDTLALAYQVDGKFGDGKRQLAKTQDELNAALSRGWITQDAYTAANREAVLVQQEQAAKAGQYKEGLDGLVAGMRLAMLQSERQNSSFNQGVQLYNEGRSAFSGFIQEVNQGLRQGADVWQTFGNAATNALNKISDKLIQMATDQLFAAAFPKTGGGGGSGGGLFSWIGGLFTGGGGGGVDPGMLSGTGGLYADGGDPPVGVPSVVGEQGPELFVPKIPGTVFNRSQLAGMAGGGDTYNVTNHFTFGSDVNRGTLMTWADAVVDRSVAAMIDKRARGGRIKKVLA